MIRTPFELFIKTFLILGKDIATTISKLAEFHYYVEPDEVSEVLDEMIGVVAESQRVKLNDKTPWSLNDEQDVQWLKQFGIWEYYDYLIRRTDKSLTDPPEYFKWYRDSLWIHAHEDVMSLVNILMFNQEPMESISDIISFRYKKKIGIEALERNKSIYWNCNDLSAKEALYYCLPFRQNALIVRNIKHANVVALNKLDADSDDGSDSAFVFHDANYIKWKIGYKNIHVPNVKDFLEKVKQDSYFKYYEAMSMAQSVEVDEESGNNNFGPFDRTLTKRRNVEEQKARAAKHWLDLYLKAEEKIPKGDSEHEGDFFSRMNQTSMAFEEEKIVSVTDIPNMLDDIKGDM